MFAHNVKFKTTANLVKFFRLPLIIDVFLLALNVVCYRPLRIPRAAKGEHAVSVKS